MAGYVLSKLPPLFARKYPESKPLEKNYYLVVLKDLKKAVVRWSNSTGWDTYQDRIIGFYEPAILSDELLKESVSSRDKV